MNAPPPHAAPRRAPPLLLIFDSGVGGLSLLPALQAALPDADLVFASDNAAYPYGTRDADSVVARTVEVVGALVTHLQPSLAIIACNTASTVALPALRSSLGCPVVGVVPAIKPAAAATRTGRIGLLATPATVARPYTAELVAMHAAHCEVITVGSSRLVDLAEQCLRGRPVPPAAIHAALTPLREHPAAAEIDAVVLGCTHFPLIRDELIAAFPGPRLWLDSAEAIARRAGALIGTRPRTGSASGTRTAIFTQAGADVTALESALSVRGFTNTTVFDTPLARSNSSPAAG